MRRRPRTKYTGTQKALMWERWKKGETLHQIARLFDRPHTSIRQVLAESGGFRPPERHDSKLTLTLAEREEISRALVAGESIRAVAARLARAPSTISREIARNGGASCYRAAQADQAAWQRAHRPKQYPGDECFGLRASEPSSFERSWWNRNSERPDACPCRATGITACRGAGGA